MESNVKLILTLNIDTDDLYTYLLHFYQALVECTARTNDYISTDTQEPTDYKQVDSI